MNFQELQQTKNNELIAIKVELKEEGIRKVNQIEGESPIKPLLFLQKRL
jgi:hypothetical protein